MAGFAFAIIGFIVVVAQLGVLIWQLQAMNTQSRAMQGQLQAMTSQTAVMQGQLDEMRKTRILDERPWVTIHDCHANLPSGTNDNSFYFSIVMENTGKTPAINVAPYTAICTNISFIIESETNQYPTNPIHSTQLPPGVPETTTTEGFPQLYGDDFKAITNGYSFYVYGVIWYEDVSRIRHWTQYSFEVSRDFKVDATTVHNLCDDNEEVQTN